MEGFLARAVTAAVVLASFGLYHLVNGRKPRTRVLMTPFDDAIPFVPAFSVPYMLYFPFLFGTVLYGILATAEWRAVAMATVLIQAAASLTYLLFQTHVPRPIVEGKGPFAALTRYVYANDQPYNCFPSLHVAHAAGCLYWSASFFPAFTAAFAALAVAIILSTMFIKQHAVADVAGGLVLVAAAFSVVSVVA